MIIPFVSTTSIPQRATTRGLYTFVLLRVWCTLALMINEDVYYGFRDVEDLEKNIPELKVLKAASVASSTAATTTKR